MENANFSLIALKANVPPSLQSCLKPSPLNAHTLTDQNNRDNITTIGYISGRGQNTVHESSSLLTSWLSESGVLTKRDMQNMQRRGHEDWNWEPLDYIMCHSAVRKLYSTVSKSTTIPGRKIGLLMFVCHSRSV